MVLLAPMINTQIKKSRGDIYPNTGGYPEQGYRPARGIIHLGNSFGNDRLEKAAKIALQHNRIRVSEIRTILKKGIDQQPIEQDRGTVQNMTNVRGQDYFKKKAGTK